MNPETDDTTPVLLTAHSPTRMDATTSSMQRAMASTSIRKSQVFQRRLKEKISESRALELLDRQIKRDQVVTNATVGNSNQDQDDELVCDSTMVRFEATPEDNAEPRGCGVLKTVRGIHRQRERDRLPTTSLDNKRENQ